MSHINDIIYACGHDANELSCDELLTSFHRYVILYPQVLKKGQCRHLYNHIEFYEYSHRIPCSDTLGISGISLSFPFTCFFTVKHCHL